MVTVNLYQSTNSRCEALKRTKKPHKKTSLAESIKLPLKISFERQRLSAANLFIGKDDHSSHLPLPTFSLIFFGSYETHKTLLTAVIITDVFDIPH